MIIIRYTNKTVAALRLLLNVNDNLISPNNITGDIVIDIIGRRALKFRISPNVKAISFFILNNKYVHNTYTENTIESVGPNTPRNLTVEIAKIKFTNINKIEP